MSWPWLHGAFWGRARKSFLAFLSRQGHGLGYRRVNVGKVRHDFLGDQRQSLQRIFGSIAAKVDLHGWFNHAKLI